MKKRVLIILAAVMALIACATAFANDTAVGLYDSMTGLLFDKKAMTLNATVEFSLDDIWFKTAEIILKQDGNRSFRKLHLRSPKADGTERENGYTIVTQGNDLYLMEDFTPEVYRTGVMQEPRTSLLRSTVETKQLIALGRVLASQADLLLGKDAITENADGEIRIALDEDRTGMVNALLNQGLLFAAKRYFGLDYDMIDAEGSYVSLYDYNTLTEGILYTARSVSLRQADITLKMGESGYPTHMAGTVSLYLETSGSGVKQLNMIFTADVTDVGKTTLKKFDADDYHVVPAPDAMELLGEEISQPENDEALKDRMMVEAKKIWDYTGFNMVSTTAVRCEWTGYYYEVSFEGGSDGMRKVAYFDEDGTFIFNQAEPADWLDNMEEDEEYDLETGLDPETDKKAQAFFMEFLKNIGFERINDVTDLQVQWTFEKNGSLYASYEDKADPNGNGVYFVIRISPEMRIENFGAVSNG